MELVRRSQPIPGMESDKTRDIISDFIAERILLCLPIREAVNTSILETKWKYRWTTLPELVFDEQSIGLNNDLMNVVDRVLTQHEGCLQKFKIYCSYLGRADSSQSWIFQLEKKRIQEIILEFWNGSLYSVPSHLFACDYLRSLKLRRCNIELPCPFNGFKSLRYLHLEMVRFQNNDFERLTSGCPVLEKLVLVNVDISSLTIHTPTLKHLHIEGVLLEIEGHDLLMYNYFKERKDRSNCLGNICNLVKILSCLSGIEKLELRCDFVKKEQALTDGTIPARFPTTFCHLTEVYSTVNFEYSDDVSLVLCLCRSSPFLKHLEVTGSINRQRQGRNRYTSEFWAMQYQASCFFNQLHTVSITGVRIGEPVMEFLKYLLRKSPALKKMTIGPWMSGMFEQLEILKSLFPFQPTSVKCSPWRVVISGEGGN